MNSFYVRLQACFRYNGESLNGKQKFMKNFNTSFEKGNEFIENKEKEIKDNRFFLRHFLNGFSIQSSYSWKVKNRHLKVKFELLC